MVRVESAIPVWPSSNIFMLEPWQPHCFSSMRGRAAVDAVVAVLADAAAAAAAAAAAGDGGSSI
jgi:hypothetical protein